MLTNFCEFKTKDGLALPGMLFEPKQKSKKALIFLHGNGSSAAFYGKERLNAMAEELNRKGISYFSFNNRGAHILHRLKRTVKGKTEKVNSGTAYEIISECVLDIDGAITFLKKLGYKEFYLCGFSTGANKICTYHYLKPNNSVTKYVLLSGGDDSGIYYGQFGKKKFFQVLKKCQQKIKQGKEQELVGKDILDFPYSYGALFDILNPEGLYNSFPFYDIFHSLNLSKKPPFLEYSKINKPTLVMYGNQDEYCYDRAPECMQLMQQYCSHPELFNFVLTKGADHGFYKKEKLLARTIANWLTKK
jgi:pimeloyl-ACP methyl ester carboxylesterase